jgi:hypothetical protein
VLNMKYLLFAVGSSIPAWENQYVSRNRTQSANDAVRADAELLRGFASGAAVDEHVPVRALRADFGGIS